MSYFVGSLTRLTAAFTDYNKTPADPTNITLSVIDPTGTKVIYAYGVDPIVRDGIGIYHYDLTLTVVGTWTYEWKGTGTIVAVQAGILTVLTFPQEAVLPPSPLDLTTVEIVQNWLSKTSESDVVNIQLCITAASIYWLKRTGRVENNGSIPAKSTLVTTDTFNEWYDGNGNDRMFLRQSPVVSVQALSVNGLTIPASTGFNTPGYVVDQNAASLVLRTSGALPRGMAYGASYGSNFGSLYFFANGTQNINVRYTAGYNGTPQDIVMACTKQVALNFKSINWTGLAQSAQPETIGTVTYVKWAIPPDVEETIQQYKRRAIV